MFVPRHYAQDDAAALDYLLAHDSFATLVSTVAGEPFASHLPVMAHRDGGTVVFEGHMARANPQWQELAAHPALLIVHGPHAYVSPSWYPQPEHSVPTWNYAVAHAVGPVELIHERDALAALVAALAARYEDRVGSHWRFPESAPSTTHELAGIVGFRLRAQRLQVKYKLNQHHEPDKVRSAAAALARQPDPDARAVSALMLEQLARRQAPETQP
ncbi:MAG TPA: FMN-binding negative transcriptional regulator [Xanthomonadaceae bacterium]|nr:FMN-binding negative transcriptional regulator [Xanthomonadaceae bacterium]